MFARKTNSSLLAGKPVHRRNPVYRENSKILLRRHVKLRLNKVGINQNQITSFNELGKITKQVFMN